MLKCWLVKLWTSQHNTRTRYVFCRHNPSVHIQINHPCWNTRHVTCGQTSTRDFPRKVDQTKSFHINDTDLEPCVHATCSCMQRHVQDYWLPKWHDFLIQFFESPQAQLYSPVISFKYIHRSHNNYDHTTRTFTISLTTHLPESYAGSYNWSIHSIFLSRKGSCRFAWGPRWSRPDAAPRCLVSLPARSASLVYPLPSGLSPLPYAEYVSLRPTSGRWPDQCAGLAGLSPPPFSQQERSSGLGNLFLVLLVWVGVREQRFTGKDPSASKLSRDRNCYHVITIVITWLQLFNPSQAVFSSTVNMAALNYVFVGLGNAALNFPCREDVTLTELRDRIEQRVS